MKLNKICSGRALYTEADKIWVARGMQFYAIDYTGRRVTEKYVIGDRKQKILSTCRLSRQLFREGIHHLLPLKNGDMFLTTKKKSYIIGKGGGVKYTFCGYRGNKPSHQGICVTPDGTIFFGEYTLNLKRENDTTLYRSTDNGKSFQPILVFKRTKIRHIHFVKYDPFEKCLWLGTGDEDRENFLMRSDDNGETWQTVGCGTQDWRSIGICFDENSVIWGTDAGSVPDQNHIVRMDRQTRKIEVLDDVEGPCHGCGSFKNGKIFISTGVEGGENETDRYARMKEIIAGKVNNICRVKKDVFPLIFQYGVMRFPLGTENTDKVVFTMLGLSGNGEKIYVGE